MEVKVEQFDVFQKPKSEFCNGEESMVFLPNIAISEREVQMDDPLKLDESNFSSPLDEECSGSQGGKHSNVSNNDLEKNKESNLESKGEHSRNSQNAECVSDVSDGLKINEVTPEELPHCCDICGESFAKSKELKLHLESHTKDIPYKHKCPYCVKVFKRLKKLNEHKLSHREAFRHYCKLCDKSFKKTAKLNIHMRNHSGEKPFVCRPCGREYMLASSLKDHQKKHHPFPCSKCDDAFGNAEDLEHHENTHAKKKPFACSFCEESFVQFSSLKEHLRFHI